MKLLALVVQFFSLRAKPKAHDDNLRAGDYTEPRFFPWKLV